MSASNAAHFHCPDNPPAGGEVLLRSNPQIWHDMQAQVLKLPPTSEPTEVVLNHDFLALHIHGPFRLHHYAEGRRNTKNSLPGSLCLEARQKSSWVGWSGSIAIVVMWLYLEPSLIQRTIAEISAIDPEHVALTSKFLFNDQFLEQTILALHAELENNNLLGQPYIEALRHVLVLHLLYHYSSMHPQLPIPVGRLSQQQLRQVKEYIYDHLEQGVSLSGIAHALGLSISYLERLFKEATGRPLYQYVIQCRVDRARHLLHDPDLTITEVAQRVGFTDQSHLHRHFKRSIGVTPGELRNTWKNIQ